MIKTLSTLILSLGLACSAWANNNTQSYDQRYMQWKQQQQIQHGRTSQTTRGTHQVSLNQASAVELQNKLTGVGVKKAQAIVEYRQKNGKFKTIDELKNVKGIGEKLFEKNRAFLAL
ncbi:helix-hairpin-helix domain-containing protein [Acinetobacter sp. ANC 4633]|uniref:ComEA family DNA-binding protein n=1 Tax=Acinetobacter sp. ANC 4633 TaxID=2529845 RepID=UPI00103F7F5D|nr:helix-hairpin-helix domain-containing protein [Acinetobacter sp. ANC 4633]TCB25768.1 helix-hairpin-helix domain-containing protein [Acinetobacter sp. ANC 4633]